MKVLKETHYRGRFSIPMGPQAQGPPCSLSALTVYIYTPAATHKFSHCWLIWRLFSWLIFSCFDVICSQKIFRRNSKWKCPQMSERLSKMFDTWCNIKHFLRRDRWVDPPDITSLNYSWTITIVSFLEMCYYVKLDGLQLKNLEISRIIRIYLPCWNVFPPETGKDQSEDRGMNLLCWDRCWLTAGTLLVEIGSYVVM